MNKITLSTLSFLLLIMVSTCTLAQDKFRASLSMGPVFPLGKFSSIANTNQSGYAQTGFNLNIDGDYHLHNRVAISLRFLFGNAPVDQSNFSKRLNDELSGYIASTDTVKYDISYWQWATPMVGVKYNYPIIINKFYFEVGASTGLAIIQIPDQNLFFNDKKNNRVVISQNVGNTDIAFPVALNAGLRFRINPRTQLKLNAEYFRTSSSFEHVSYYQLENKIEKNEIEKYTFNVPIQTVAISAGLVYNF